MRELRELVGERIAEEGLVIASRELIGEAQHEIGFALVHYRSAVSAWLLIDVRELVANLVAALNPAKVCRFTTDADPHAVVVEGLILCKVDNVELDPLLCELLRIPDREIEPLVMTLGVGVDLHVQIIFIVSSLHSDVEVPRLEVRVEDQFALSRKGWIHAYEFPRWLWFVCLLDYLLD